MDHRRQSFSFVKAMTNTVLTTFPELSTEDVMETEDVPPSKENAGEALVSRVSGLFESILIAASVDKLNELSGEYVDDLCRHFAVLWAQKIEAKPSREAKVDSFVWVNAMVDAICVDNRNHIKMACKAIENMVEMCKLTIKENLDDSPHFDLLITK